MAPAAQIHWYLSWPACVLCDGERQLAHIVRTGDRWFAYDATQPDAERTGCLFLGSFVRLFTAMETAELETFRGEGFVPQTDESDRVPVGAIKMPRNSAGAMAESPHLRHSHR